MNQSGKIKYMKTHFDANRDPNFGRSTDFLLGLLGSLPLPAHYKTDHLLDKLANLPAADQPTAVESVSLNAVNVQTIFMQSADVYLWHPDDDAGPAYRNRECRVKRIQVNKSAFTSDLYLEAVFDDEVFEYPIFASDAVAIYDSSTEVNLLNVGTMNNYWSRDPDVITVNAVKITKDDPILHNYEPYTTRFKYPVKVTGAVGTTDIHPLGEGFLHLPAPIPCSFLAI